MKAMREQLNNKLDFYIKNFKLLILALILPISIVPLIIFSNIFYLITDIFFLILRIILKESFKLDTLQRDCNGCLYKNLSILNMHFYCKQPMILWTYKRVSYYDHKSLLY